MTPALLIATLATLTADPAPHRPNLPPLPISRFYAPTDFISSDGARHTIDPRLILILDDLTQQFGRFEILSAYRSPDTNRRAGGRPRSYHLSGHAIDIRPHNADVHTIATWARQHYPTIGIGLYTHRPHPFLHIDTRVTPFTWTD